MGDWEEGEDPPSPPSPCFSGRVGGWKVFPSSDWGTRRDQEGRRTPSTRQALAFMPGTGSSLAAWMIRRREEAASGVSCVYIERRRRWVGGWVGG